MKSKKNPYAKHFKQAIALRLDKEVISYFKNLSEELDIPYQTLINFYLLDCARQNKKLEMSWEKAS